MDNNHETNALQHHGIKGMKWGVRRYQNKDGSLTPLGEKRMNSKSGTDKKGREDLKDRRVSRALNALKQRQDMRQDRLDRENNRTIERAKFKLAQQKARDESADQAMNRKMLNERLKQERANRKQDARDRAADRKLAKDDRATRSDEYYELPDTPERQSASRANGKKIAGAAIAAVGAVALAVAAKKYGPTILSKFKNANLGDKAKNVGDKAKNAADKASDIKDTVDMLKTMKPEIEKALEGVVSSKSSTTSNTSKNTTYRNADIYDVDWSDLSDAFRSSGSSASSTAALVSPATSNALNSVRDIRLLEEPK
jgi:hypothetical protein